MNRKILFSLKFIDEKVMPPVHIDELIEYLKKITGHEFTEMEKFAILELIHFGRSSKKKDGKYYMSPPG